MTKPKVKDFEAFINRQPPGPPNLYVIGKVETHNGSLNPVLRPAQSPDLNENILGLDLTIEQTDDVGTKDIAFRDARYDHDGDASNIEAVKIRFDGEEILSLTPKDVH